ncbi:MAG TPA: D-hexose-6-phosphate mutarotase [Rhodocyclaceae bacterium]|nr:D-hexose-6-phosphate mutarotase [Rhodocyclaceae bacterium]
MSEAGLNHEFGIPGAVRFEQSPEGLLLARISSDGGTADICLQGAHVFSWNVKGLLEPVLWLSREAKFQAGKSLRGGIPVCWPWFGPHAEGGSFPAHGFARTATWDVAASDVDGSGAVCLTLTLEPESMPEAMWPHATTLELKVSLGATLKLELSTRNIGSQAFVLGEALHTYFNISDIGNVAVHGLHGVEYWDTVGTVEKKVQAGAIDFSAETDRVYIHSPQACSIDDPGFARRIHIHKQGSLSTVVWNPWVAKAERMGDLGKPDGWRQMLCVESANAWDNKLTLAPGERHTLSVEYRVEPL